MRLINNLAQIRSLMFDMELKIGIQSMPRLEREVLLACADLENSQSNVKAKEILNHRFLASFSRPSIFRTLKSLIEKKYLTQSTDRRGYYSILDQLEP